MMPILVEEQGRTRRDRFNRPPYSVSCTDNSTHSPPTSPCLSGSVTTTEARIN